MASGALDIRIAGRYRLGRKIGSGSFGDIYLGAAPRGEPRAGRAVFHCAGALTRDVCAQASTSRPARRSA